MRINILIVCLFAVVLRILWAYFIPVIPVSDSAAYDVFAQNIWLHGTYGWEIEAPSSYWPVGTAAIYSGFYALFGHSYVPIVVLNICCTVGILIYIRKLTERYFDSSTLGLYSALAVAFWPTGIYFTTVLASELPYTFLILAGFYYFTMPDRKCFKYGLIAGLIFAAAYYIRPLAVVPLGIAVFSLYLRLEQKKIAICRGIVSVLVLVTLVAPWAYRNYVLYDHFLPMSSNGGATLWMGNHSGSNGSYSQLPQNVAGLNEYERDKKLKRDAIAYIKQEPLAFIVRTSKKFVTFHLRETIGVTWNEDGIEKRFGQEVVLPLKVLSQSYWSIAFILSILGLILYYKRNGFWPTVSNPFVLLWISSAVIHSIIVSQDRYHIPIAPLIFVFTINCLHSIRNEIINNKYEAKNGT